MTDLFCDFLSIEQRKTTLQHKKTTVQSYRKMSIQNTKKSPAIKFALSNYTGVIGMDNFGFMSISLSLFLFCTKPAEEIYDVCMLTAVSSTFLHMSQYVFSCTKPSPLREYILYRWPRNYNHRIKKLVNLYQTSSRL